MKKLYWVIWGQYRKSEKPQTVLSTICSRCMNEDEKILKEELK